MNRAGIGICSIRVNEKVKLGEPLNDVECGQQASPILSEPTLAQIEFDAPVRWVRLVLRDVEGLEPHSQQ